jgi:hypothetical protein
MRVGRLSLMPSQMCVRRFGCIDMIALRLRQYLLLAIGLLYLSSPAAQVNADPVRGGETIKMGTYVVTAPVGDGWRIQKDPIRDALLFQRDDPPTTIGVAPQSLPASNPIVDEDHIVAMVFDSEEKNIRDRGLSRSYAPSGVTREVLVVSGKTVHVMRYSVTQLGLQPPLNPVVMRYAMYLYLPENWKESKRWYTFVIGAPQQMGGTRSAPILKEIDAVIAAFRPL